MNKVNVCFTEAYARCTREVPYNPSWSNGSGNFDFAVYGEHAPKLGNGDFIKSATPSGRRVMIIGTRLGNVAIYDRFTQQQEGQTGAHKAVFSFNATASLMTGGWFSRTWLDDYEMSIAVGDGVEGNIGWRIEQLQSALKKMATT